MEILNNRILSFLITEYCYNSSPREFGFQSDKSMFVFSSKTKNHALSLTCLETILVSIITNDVEKYIGIDICVIYDYE